MSNESPLDKYLDDIGRIRGTRAGTPETSYYPALGAVLNLVGDRLKPRVFCLHHPSGDAGIPDFGLFEQNQFGRSEQPAWAAAVTPSRGVVEAKGAGHSMATLLASKQITRDYLPQYGLVLATNLWQFRLIGQGGKLLESFDLAADEASFWVLVQASRPKPLAARFADFLQRCLLTRAPLAKPSDVAFFLASYARDAMARLDERADLPALANLRAGMQSALGVEFDRREGEHLFRSTLVQTLFYGLFSAWVTETRRGVRPFNWRTAQWALTVPVARFLFGQVATPEALEPLQLVPLLDAAGEALNRVDADAFFTAFDDAQAVQYFYEPFLQFFDPELRKELGVWYTPPEIVTYMVERVDRVLRSELGIADGLADERVWVLDPCCGTGSFVVAVLDRIRRTLESRGLGDLAAEQLKQAATTRIVGFEIMTAPLVIAHWQVGEALRRAGAPLQQGERASVYLTNALTGWDSSEVRREFSGFDALLAERSASAAVKQAKPVLVVLGNPPYNAYAGVSPASERGLVEPYKAGLRERFGVKKYNLDDLFVRFFRIAERRIAETTGQGVVCYVSNFAWLFLPSFTVMRERLLREFDSVWIDNLNGDSRETGKVTPSGKPDPSVFSTPTNREGIRVGAAISLLVRRAERGSPKAWFRQFWGVNKRAELLESLDPSSTVQFVQLHPTERNLFLLRSASGVAAYADWPSLADLARESPMLGLNENRGGALSGITRIEVENIMKPYFDRALSFDQIKEKISGLAKDWASFPAKKSRDYINLIECFSETNISAFVYRPFDMRWAYISPVAKLWNRSRPELQHVLPDAGGFLTTRIQAIADPEGFPAFFSRFLADQHAQHKDIFLIPIIENLSGAPRPNLSETAIAYLATLDLPADSTSARLIWMHALATLYSPAYLADNAGAIRQGWPRIPLPPTAAALHGSAALGERLAALLDPDTAVPGVTSGEIRPELRAIAVPTTTPDAPRDWQLSAGWGTRTDKGITMPGRGQVVTRPYGAAEAATEAQADALGTETTDIWLNPTTCWRNVPRAVWDCRIGGYQVIKKWLSYRDASIIHRALSTDEVAHVQQTARRLAAVLLLAPELDESHRSCACRQRG